MSPCLCGKKVFMKTIEKKRKQLIFRSHHRGMKEMDLIMGSFADTHVGGFDERALAQYEELLQNNDPDLYNWITGKENAPANVVSDVFELLKKHKII